MSSNAEPLCTLAETRRFLDYQDPTAVSPNDEELKRLIDYAAAALAGLALLPRRDDGSLPSFVEDEFTDTYDGNGGGVLMLRHSPATNVTSVTIGTLTVPRATDGVMTGFLANSFAVRLRGYRFTRGIGNVSVTYTAGLQDDDPVLAELKESALELIAYVLRTKPFIGIQSKTLGHETVVYMRQAMPERMVKLCDRIRMRYVA